MLSNDAEVTETMVATVARFVCAAYSPKASTSRTSPNCEVISSASIWQKVTSYLILWALRALRQHVLRVHPSQSVGTGQHCSAGSDPHLDPPQNGHHKKSDGQLKPTTTNALPAPKAIIETVSCQCKTDCSSARCSCRTQNLSCTNLCQCSSECQNDEDTQKLNKYETDDDDDSNDIWRLKVVQKIKRISVMRSMLVFNGH